MRYQEVILPFFWNARTDSLHWYWSTGKPNGYMLKTLAAVGSC